MISRFLEKKAVVAEREITKGEGDPLELEYYLVETVGTDSSGETDSKEYGVEIVERESGIVTDSKMFKNIYTSRNEAQKLIETLARNFVTPVSLPYILDDMLGDV